MPDSPKRVVVAGDFLQLTITTTDFAGAAETPDSATYETIDKTSGDQLRAPSAITPITSATFAVVLDATDTANNDATKSAEERWIIIRATFVAEVAVEIFKFVVLRPS